MQVENIMNCGMHRRNITADNSIKLYFFCKRGGGGGGRIKK